MLKTPCMLLCLNWFILATIDFRLLLYTVYSSLALPQSVVLKSTASCAANAAVTMQMHER